jgi:hypothetical protein
MLNRRHPQGQEKPTVLDRFDESTEALHDQHEENRRQRIPLPKPPTMANSATGRAIKEHLSTGGGENRGDPINLDPRTTNSRQKVQEKYPPDRVESFR